MVAAMILEQERVFGGNPNDGRNEWSMSIGNDLTRISSLILSGGND
jgi:hypothetical protein